MKLRHLLPDSIAGRTIAILVVGLTASHLVSIGAYHFDASSLDERTFEHRLADTLVSVRTSLAEAAPQERDHLARLLTTPSFDVHLDGASATEPKDRAEAIAADLEGLRGRLDALRPELREWDLSLRHVVAGREGDGRRAETIVASVSLPGETVVRLHAAPPDDDMYASTRVLLSTGLMAATVLALSLLMIRATLAPLRAMGRAAERLGVDVGAPPLAEDGPAEIRSAARAFNDMQHRIERLLEDRTQMLAAVSHDLRTPLTVMQLRTEFIEDDELRRRFIADISEMEAMIVSTLSYLRDERAGEHSEVVDLAALVETICDGFADAGRPVAYEGPGRLPFRCRAIALKRAFTNLVDNGLKYGKRVSVGLTILDGVVVVTIDDEGPGIPKAERERVFAPFYRLEDSRNKETGGFGLGMAVARTTIRAHGGDIALGDRPGGGLRVTVTLPHVRG